MKKLLSLLIILIISLSIITVKADIVNTQNSGSISSGLVGYWRLDDNNGSIALDSSNNGLNSVLSNSPLFLSSGKFNNALNFNGVNQYGLVNNNVLFNIGAGNLTMSCWVRIMSNSGTGSQVILRLDNETTNPRQLISLSRQNNSIWAEIYDSTKNDYVTHGYLDNDTNFHLFTIVKLDTNLYLYVDGSYFYNITIPLGISVGSTGALSFGKDEVANSEKFNGTIDDVRFYNRALSVSEISLLYTGMPISVSYDLGSTINPNSTTVYCGVDQNKSFIIGSQIGYLPSTQWINNTAYNPINVFNFINLENSYNYYVTSQFIGYAPTPTPLITPTPTPLSDTGYNNIITIINNSNANIQYLIIGSIFIVLALIIGYLVNKRKN